MLKLSPGPSWPAAKSQTIGLSDMSAYRTNLPGGWNMARVFSATFNASVNTHATATTASPNGVEKSFGLVVGFQQ